MKLNIGHIEQLLDDGVRHKIYPGAVWAVGGIDNPRSVGAVGLLDPTQASVPMQTDTVFDIASLTKVIAVWASIGSLWENRQLPLDESLGSFWPEVAEHPLAQVTARQLLTHTAGVPLRANLKNLYGTNPQKIREGVLREKLHRLPGEAVEYTDRAALILGYLAEYLSGLSLDQLAERQIWHPLGMTQTTFGPLSSKMASKCAPTERDQDTNVPLKGVAHDFSARLLGGVCGIAGTFSVADDLGKFLTYMMTPSAAPGCGFSDAWVQASLKIHTGDLLPARGLFWHPAPRTGPTDDVYVHYGFTGTGIWISRKRRRWAVLLTNKLYYTRDREPLTILRDRFRQLVFS